MRPIIIQAISFVAGFFSPSPDQPLEVSLSLQAGDTSVPLLEMELGRRIEENSTGTNNKETTPNPCKVCGSSDIKIDVNSPGFSIHCRGCFEFVLVGGGSRGEAIVEWNKKQGDGI